MRDRCTASAGGAFVAVDAELGALLLQRHPAQPGRVGCRWPVTL